MAQEIYSQLKCYARPVDLEKGVRVHYLIKAFFPFFAQ